MKIAGKTVIVTGAASGIGLALAARFLREGAKGVVMADIQREALQAAARQVGGLAVACDVTREDEVRALIAEAERAFGSVDIYVSNAGVARWGGLETPDPDWTLSWQLHVMAHLYAARVLMPKMAAQGVGYFIITASAAGLLSHINSASYATTKHASVGFAEYLSIAYGGQGVQVSVLCPQQVRTAMTQGREKSVSAVDGAIEPEAVADCVVAGIEKGGFLMLPHPTVIDYLRRKTADYDRWLAGMRRLLDRFSGADSTSPPTPHQQ